MRGSENAILMAACHAYIRPIAASPGPDSLAPPLTRSLMPANVSKRVAPATSTDNIIAGLLIFFAVSKVIAILFSISLFSETDAIIINFNWKDYFCLALNLGFFLLII